MLKNSEKMKQLVFTTTLVLAVLISACDNPNDAGYNTEFTIQLAHSIKTTDSRYIIRFDSIITDSRCPEGAQCFWAGTAGTKFTLSENNEKPVTFDLYIPEYPHLNWNKTFIYKNIKIELLQLTPYPSLNSDKNYEPYKATVRLTRID